jgi:hypothetical protein
VASVHLIGWYSRVQTVQIARGTDVLHCGTGTRGAVALQKTIHRWLFSRALAWAIPAGETREMVQEALDRAEWNFAAAEVVAIVDAECSAIEELASTTAAEALYEEETAERPFKMA